MQWAPRTPQGNKKDPLQENSLLSLSCTSPWPPSWRSCLNPPEHDSNICLGDLTEVNAVLHLAVTSPYVGLCSLTLLWDGLCAVPVALLLAARIWGAVLNLHILPVDGYSSGCLGDKATSLLVGFTENRNQLANSVYWSLVLNPGSFSEQKTFEPEVCLSC